MPGTLRSFARSLALAALATLAGAFFVAVPPAAGLTLKPVGSFSSPVFVTSDPADASRLLVVEREGRVVESTPEGKRTLADIGPLVECCAGERGLLSIAPAPDFHSSGRFYAAFAGTAAAGGAIGDFHVDSFRPDPSDEDNLIREPILSIGHAAHTDHYGGQLQFGPDGYLYISTGDGAGGGDPLENAQDLESLQGKVLRIDPRPGQVPPYVAPADNPFAAATGRDEIWAYGLRNPWRFSFDRGDGGMTIADVGQDLFEEVDYAPSPSPGVVGGAGANYGWNCREGFDAFAGAASLCATASGFVEPAFAYSHTAPDGTHRCAVIGGYVVRDPSLGELFGRYVYTDLCQGEIRSLVLPSDGGLASDDRSEGVSLQGPTAFGEDAGGGLYVATLGGEVYRLTADPPPVQGEEGTQTESAAGRDVAPRPRLRLAAKAIGPDAANRFLITARFLPCPIGGEWKVVFKRGRRSVGSAKLNAHCRASVRVEVTHRSTFRAILRPPESATRIRSGRLVLVPAS